MEIPLIEQLVSRLCKNDLQEFLIDTELNLENQRVISMDVLRTRSETLTSNERLVLEKMLTFYCKTEKLSYKQGMNEILAPFLLLTRYNIPEYISYYCFKSFVEKFIPTLFVDDVIFYLEL